MPETVRTMLTCNSPLPKLRCLAPTQALQPNLPHMRQMLEPWTLGTLLPYRRERTPKDAVHRRSSSTFSTAAN
jgi:hypothetical protein